MPFAKHFPIFALATGLTIAASWLNNRNFKPVYSMAPEYKTKENIIVSVAESRVCGLCSVGSYVGSAGSARAYVG